MEVLGLHWLKPVADWNSTMLNSSSILKHLCTFVHSVSRLRKVMISGHWTWEAV